MPIPGIPAVDGSVRSVYTRKDKTNSATVVMGIGKTTNIKRGDFLLNILPTYVRNQITPTSIQINVRQNKTNEKSDNNWVNIKSI